MSHLKTMASHATARRMTACCVGVLVAVLAFASCTGPGHPGSVPPSCGYPTVCAYVTTHVRDTSSIVLWATGAPASGNHEDRCEVYVLDGGEVTIGHVHFKGVGARLYLGVAIGPSGRTVTGLYTGRLGNVDRPHCVNGAWRLAVAIPGQ